MSSPLTTRDGHLVDVGPVEMHSLFQKPMVHGTLRIPMDPSLRAFLKENVALVELIGRSGWGQVGLHGQRGELLLEDTSEGVELPVDVLGLLGDQNLRILNTLHTVSGALPIEMGRLLVRQLEQALSAEEIHAAIAAHQLMLPEGAKICEDGLLTIPLSNLHYLLCLDNIAHPDDILRFLRLGKHGLHQVRDLDPRPLPQSIGAGKFFLGGIHLSIGPYTAVIESNMLLGGEADSELFHLAPRVLDGIITTGMQVARQVELYNNKSGPVLTRDIRVPIRIYRGAEDLQEKAHLVNARTIRRGVQLSDVLELDQGPATLIELMTLVGRDGNGEKPHAHILSRRRSAAVPWMPTPHLQKESIKGRATGLMSRREGYNNGATPVFIKRICKLLAYVGGEQNHSAFMVSQAFPDPEVMGALLEEGISAFVAQDLRWAPGMFPILGEPLNSEMGRSDLYFDWMRYAEFCQLEKRGASIHMVYPEMPGLPAHVREFHRGFWVKPEAKERFDQVDTILAMYGSHVNEVDAVLSPQMAPFMERMKNLLGNRGAVTHGKGPGAMLAADRAAEQAGLLRIGVGIGVEKLGQDPNFAPEAMVDFIDKDRLPRQKLMDDMTTIRLFNVGGAGTLEEVATTLCSQKLGKNVVAPMIFIDPLGLDDGEHLFTALRHQIEVMVREHKIPKADGETATARLLAAYNLGYIHLVKSYDKAADIIEAYVRDPITYYEKQRIPYEFVKRAYETAQATFAETGFPSPHFLPKNLVDSPDTQRRLTFA